MSNYSESDSVLISSSLASTGREETHIKSREQSDSVPQFEAPHQNLEEQLNSAIRDVQQLLEQESPTGMQSTDSKIPNSYESVSEPGESSVSAPVVEETDDVTAIDALSAVNRQMFEIITRRRDTENKLVTGIEAIATLQTEVSKRRNEEEELRKKLEEDATRRRRDDAAKLEDQRKQLSDCDDELRAIWVEEQRLRSESIRLNQAVYESLQRQARAEEDAKLNFLAEVRRARDEADRQHTESIGKLNSEQEALRAAVAHLNAQRFEAEKESKQVAEELRKLDEEKSRLIAEVSTRSSEVTRIRIEAEQRLLVESNRLATQELEFGRLTEALAQRRQELEVARQKADEDARRIESATARMRAAEEASSRAERERLVLEAEIFRRAETERSLLDEARARADEAHRQFETNAREREEREALRMSELEAARLTAESSAQQHADKERSLGREIEALEANVQSTLSKITELEARRSSTNDTHERLLERLRVVEDEVLLRSSQEAKTRAAIEKRIQDEVEEMRRMEDEHRKRLDDEIARRVAAEQGLQQIRDRYQSEQAARIAAELKFENWKDQAPRKSDQPVASAEPMEPTMVTPELLSVSAAPQNGVETNWGNDFEATKVPVYQVGNLGSSDPRLRADAVFALARLGSKDAFDLIANSFDDESSIVRNAAAQAMLLLEPHRPVESFTRALKEGTPERGLRIGKAISESGLAAQAVRALVESDSEGAYNGLCLLFAMAKAGEVEPLAHAVETHDDAEVRVAAIRLLKLSGHETLASEAIERRLKPSRRVEV